MKPFPPTMKEKRRYVKFVFNEPLEEKDVKHALNRAVLNVLGESGFAESNFSVVEFSGQELVCRATNKKLYEVIAAITLVIEVNGVKTRFLLENVSGTVKKTK